MALSSSRTLPGQSCCNSIRNAALEIPLRGPAAALGVYLQKVIGQHRDVPTTLPEGAGISMGEGRQRDTADLHGKSPLFDPRPRGSLLVATIDPDIDGGWCRNRPHAGTSRSCNTRKSLAWSAGLHVADLVKQDGPAVGPLEGADSPFVGRARKRPMFVSRTTRSPSVLRGMAAQLRGHERPLVPRTVGVKHPRHEFLAGYRSRPRINTVMSLPAALANQCVDLLHGSTGADHALHGLRGLRQLGAQPAATRPSCARFPRLRIHPGRHGGRPPPSPPLSRTREVAR